MKLTTLFILGVPLVQAQAPPASGDNGAIGGIFGAGNAMNIGMLGKSGKGIPSLGKSGKGPGGKGFGGILGALGKAGDVDLETALGGAFGGKGAEGVTGSTLTPEQWAHPGTGPYPAKFFTGILYRCPNRLVFTHNIDPSLPEKTIYAPIVPPKDNIKMPVVVWAEGGCFKTGTFYQPYLTEIASHGYLVLANGPPVGGPPKTVADMGKLMTLGQNKISDLQASIDWALKGNGSKYGNIDTTKIAAGGQSCGGTEA
jgi:hypothetical protein